jgi:hypothetical protein
MPAPFAILVGDDEPDLMHSLNKASKRSFQEASFVQVHRVDQATTYIND